jgi:hypothetical protein
VSVDVAAALPNVLLADVVCTVFEGEGLGKAAATSAYRAANRSAFARASGVCNGKGLLESVIDSESNGRDRKFSLC